MIATILKQIYPLDSYQVILAHGRFPQNAYLQDLIRNASTLICCDGAIGKSLEHQIQPDYIVGDGDSLTPQIKTQFSEKIIVISDQNTNDLTKAVNLAAKLELQNVVILGATGLREDHTIANIGLLVEYQKLIKNITIVSDYGMFTVHNDTCTLSTINGQQISFFTMDSKIEISCAELKWPLHQYKLAAWQSGTLNQASGKYITVTSTGNIIVYRAFEVKT